MLERKEGEEEEQGAERERQIEIIGQEKGTVA